MVLLARHPQAFLQAKRPIIALALGPCQRLGPSFSFGFGKRYLYCNRPGTVAVRRGHSHLLPWLMRRGCLLDPEGALEAAAERCDLAGEQRRPGGAGAGAGGGGLPARRRHGQR